jgi:hypothetical protein
LTALIGTPFQINSARSSAISRGDDQNQFNIGLDFPRTGITDAIRSANSVQGQFAEIRAKYDPFVPDLLDNRETEDISIKTRK